MLYDTLLHTLQTTGTAGCATVLSGPHLGEKWHFSDPVPSGWEPVAERLLALPRTAAVCLDGVSYLVERFSVLQPELTIFGGGHISVPLCRLGAMLGFAVRVIDDREKFAAPARFPEAAHVLCADFSEVGELLPQDPNGFYVIVTRGHLGDQICAELVLSRPFAYCGMIGSKKKVALSRERLEQAGFSPEVIARLHAPIGLSIGAQTPEEIAVAIAAELIQERRQHGTAYLSPDLLDGLRAARFGDVLLTIVRKEGSAPRGVGSKLLLRADGTQIGSIGGGAGEFRACQDALRTEIPLLRRYSMRPGDELGMVCGGEIDVLAEPLFSARERP